MPTEIKLILALDQIKNVSNLLKGNKWEKFFASHLIEIKIEIERQLSLAKG
jgi:hypothetical protein